VTTVLLKSLAAHRPLVVVQTDARNWKAGFILQDRLVPGPLW
jgi:hypothetical protein